MAKMKITDEQIRRHLQEGLKQREIADRYDMLPSTLSRRIRKLREKEAETSRLPQPAQNIQPMDTVVRRSDRTWFRVRGIDNEKAVPHKVIAGEYPCRRQKITVSSDRLEPDFEKKGG